MGRGANLTKAKKIKNDEFYTLYEDIEKELVNYKKEFKGKVIYCNCDNPKYSEFWRYFHTNFYELGLKCLISTYYDECNEAYKTIYDGVKCSKELLFQSGDFRSVECVDIWDVEADIVVTNPPFSLFGDFISIFCELKKDFIVVGSKNNVLRKDFFELLKNEKVRYGFSSIKRFKQRDGELKNFGNIGWFTTLNVSQSRVSLLLKEKYYDVNGVPFNDKYIKYANYDAINIDRVQDIPVDYTGLMGVPLTFLEKQTTSKFDIIGLLCHGDTIPNPVKLGEEFIELYRGQGNKGHVSANMYGVYYKDRDGRVVLPFGRVLIKKSSKEV